jgi:proline iminopeptidase
MVHAPVRLRCRPSTRAGRSRVWGLLLCAACSASHAAPGTLRAGELPRDREGYVLGAEGLRLFYRVEGAGADTVVVLHGGPGLNLEGLRPDLEPLARRHTVIYFDQRGSGHSDMPDTLRLTVDLMVKDLEAIRHAFRMDRMTLLGHSWGGGYAVLYAAEYPEHVGRMILVGPVPPRPGAYLEQYDSGLAARRDRAETAQQAVSDSIQKVAEDPYPACRVSIRIFLRGVAATPETASRIKGDLCAATPTNLRLEGVLRGRVWGSIWDTAAVEGYDWRPLARHVSVPTLVVHGDEDPLPLAGSEEWARVLPQARLVVISHAGHYSHAEQPAQFFRVVEAFLSTQSP